MSMTEIQYDAKLHQVRLCQASNNAYYLIGLIFDDKKKRWRDGTAITTSVIPDHTGAPLVEGRVYETLNTRYLITSVRNRGVRRI